MRTTRPLLIQGTAAAAFQVQGLQRTGHRIETGGEDDDVEFVFLATGSDALFGDFFNTAVGIGIDQQHVILLKVS
jgi:hypothetical protein